MSNLDRDVIKRNAIAFWQQSRLNKPVKVTSFSRSPTLWGEGYITCYKFIAGRTLQAVERILGLRAGELVNGAYVYEFLRLPTPDEFDTRGYTQTPGGNTWAPSSAYPVGAGAAQWEIRRNTFVPTRLIAAVQSGQLIP